METEKIQYWLGLSAFGKIGPKRFELLYRYFKSVKNIWGSEEKDLMAAGLPKNISQQFIIFRQNFDKPSCFLRLQKLGIRIVTLEDKEYPENLKSMADRPFLLYIIGQILPYDNLALGLVGTRKITSYGRIVTENLTSILVDQKITIVSGLAYGVDSVAHRTALDCGGRTIGVWAGGLDTVTDGQRRDLVKRIVGEDKGAVISEYPLGFAPQVSTFPQRNRIIAGMSLGVLVTEAAEDSGSLITAKYSQKIKRPVFAVPGPITSATTSGTAKLLKDGAKLVYSGKEILETLNIEQRTKNMGARKILPDDKNEEIILKILEREPKAIDQIVRESKKATGEIVAIIALMEIKGKIKNLGGAIYAISTR